MNECHYYHHKPLDTENKNPLRYSYGFLEQYKCVIYTKYRTCVYWENLLRCHAKTRSAFTCSKPIMETPAQYMKYGQRQQLRQQQNDVIDEQLNAGWEELIFLELIIHLISCLVTLWTLQMTVLKKSMTVSLQT